MRDLMLFFFDEPAASSPVSTDYIQENGPPAGAPQLIESPPWFDDAPDVSPIADDYQQLDVSPPDRTSIKDGWNHFEDEQAEDSFGPNTLSLVGDVAPSVASPTQEQWAFDDFTFIDAVPDSFQQTDNSAGTAPIAVADVPRFWDDDFGGMAAGVPDSYLQTNSDSRPPGDSPMFDGADEDLDELLIIDFANFTTALPKQFEDDFHQQFQDAVDDWSYGLTFAPVGADNTPIQPTGPVFDGNDYDLDELVIIDFANFTTGREQTPDHTWNWEEEPQDWSPPPEGPVRTVPTNVDPTPGLILVTGYEPQVQTGQFYSPTPGIINVVGSAPLVQQTRNIDMLTGGVNVVGYAPMVTQVIEPQPGIINVIGYAPTVGLGQGIFPPPGVINAIGYAPVISQPHAVALAVGGINVVGFPPEISSLVGIVPSPGVISVSGGAPEITQPRDITPEPGTINVIGLVPVVESTNSIRPDVGVIFVGTGEPEVFQLTTPRARQIDIDPEERVIDPRAP